MHIVGVNKTYWISDNSLEILLFILYLMSTSQKTELQKSILTRLFFIQRLDSNSFYALAIKKEDREFGLLRNTYAIMSYDTYFGESTGGLTKDRSASFTMSCMRWVPKTFLLSTRKVVLKQMLYISNVVTILTYCTYSCQTMWHEHTSYKYHRIKRD